MGNVVKLGAPGALRDYTLEPQGEGIAWSRGPANPYAATVNTSNQFDTVDIWNEYTQEDWQTGVGRVDPLAGGFLYAEAETRVPNQVILPPLVKMASTRTLDGTRFDCQFMPDAISGSISVGAAARSKVAMRFVTPNPLVGVSAGFFFYARIDPSVAVRLSIYTNSGGSPGTVVNTTAAFNGASITRAFGWHGVSIPYGTMTAATEYWLVIEADDGVSTFDVAYATSGYANVAQGWNGTAWGNIDNTYLLYTTGLHRMYDVNSAEQGLVRFNGELYTWQNESLYKYNAANDNFTFVGTILGTGAVNSGVVFGPYIYFSRFSSTYTRMDTAETFAASALTASGFAEHKGLLYRSYQNDLYYSNDGTTWTGPFAVGGDDVNIRGMAGMGDSLYLATDKALMRFAPGDVVEEAARFGMEDSNNGVGMMEYQGRLYIPAAGRIFRFDPSGQLQDIWASREGELPASRLGHIVGLARMNNWLVAEVIPIAPGGYTSVWAFQEEGWHFLAYGLMNDAAADPSVRYRMLYDRENSRLWFTAPRVWHYISVEDYTLNPYTSSSYKYSPYGWLEQDKYYGGQYLLNKNWESVTIVGENLSASQNAMVYWQDPDSTDWELLGTVTADGQELRWDTPATRPVGKWIKIAVLLGTTTSTETPRVRAIVVKFLPMVNDRIRDNLTIALSDNAQMPDGDPDAYTLAEQHAHLTGSAVIGAEGIVIYQDPLGIQYEVQVIDYNQAILGYAHYNGANRIKDMRVILTVEQVTESPYVA